MDTYSKTFDPRERLFDMHAILDICSSFVSLSEPFPGAQDHQQLIHLAHYSVKEYLCSKQKNVGWLSEVEWTAEGADVFMAQTCLVYLLSLNDADSFVHSLFNFELDLQLPFLRYATCNWYDHYQAVSDEKDESVTQLVISLFNMDNDNGHAYTNWLKAWYRYHDSCHYNFRFLMKEGEPYTAPLTVASGINITKVVKMLLQRCDPQSLRGNTIGEAIEVASAEGWFGIVRMLLDAVPE